MADVRLTATNPDDSTVVPVACNAKGELKLEEPPEFDGTFDGDLTITGNATFTGTVNTGDWPNDASTSSGGGAHLLRNDTSTNVVWKAFSGGLADSDITSQILANGSATFAGLITSGPSALIDGRVRYTTYGTDFSVGSNSNYFLAHYSSDNTVYIGLKNDGSATFAEGNFSVNSNAYTNIQRRYDGDVKHTVLELQTSSGPSYLKGTVTGDPAARFEIFQSGNATFKGDVVVGSRGQKWTLVEQGGLCHMVAYESRSVDPAFGVNPADAEYPELRDVFKELDMIESALQEVMERLKMAPPSGWEVWDGSDT